MGTFKIVLSVIEVLACIAVMGIILLQKGSEQGLSGAIAGGSNDSFYGKNRSRTSDAVLRKLTAGLSAAVVIIAVLLNCIK